MLIETKTEKIIRDSDDAPIKKGDILVMEIDGKTVIGIFDGLTKQNTLSFRSMLKKNPFKVRPISIGECHLVERLILRKNDAE